MGNKQNNELAKINQQLNTAGWLLGRSVAPTMTATLVERSK